MEAEERQRPGVHGDEIHIAGFLSRAQVPHAFHAFSSFPDRTIMSALLDNGGGTMLIGGHALHEGLGGSASLRIGLELVALFTSKLASPGEGRAPAQTS